MICARRVRRRPSSPTWDLSWSAGTCRSHVSTISLCLKWPLGFPVPAPGCSEFPLCRPRTRVLISSASYTRVWRLEGSGTALFEPPSLKPSLTAFQLSVWLIGLPGVPSFPDVFQDRNWWTTAQRSAKQNASPAVKANSCPPGTERNTVTSTDTATPVRGLRGKGALGSQADIPAHSWQYSHPGFFFFNSQGLFWLVRVWVVLVVT